MQQRRQQIDCAYDVMLFVVSCTLLVQALLITQLECGDWRKEPRLGARTRGLLSQANKCMCSLGNEQLQTFCVYMIIAIIS